MKRIVFELSAKEVASVSDGGGGVEVVGGDTMVEVVESDGCEEEEVVVVVGGGGGVASEEEEEEVEEGSCDVSSRRDMSGSAECAMVDFSVGGGVPSLLFSWDASSLMADCEGDDECDEEEEEDDDDETS